MKERLDVLLVNNGLAETREKAKRTIMAGLVTVDGRLEDKPGTRFDIDSDVQVKGQECPYVSRGGLKLEKALKVFPVSPEGKVCMDVGASTGGFTDCMLQNGAVRVYAVDVGRGQLDWKLRGDPRVVCMEKTNIRYLKPEDVDAPADFLTTDVSFISLGLVLPPARNLMRDHADAVVLIKPQFEAGKDKVGKKGVVRDRKVHEEVIRKVIGIAHEHFFATMGLDYSPIRGPEGNIEYLMYLRRNHEDAGGDRDQEHPSAKDRQETIPDRDKIRDETREEIREIVRRSHETL